MLIAKNGGPQVSGSRKLAAESAQILVEFLTEDQKQIVSKFSSGEISLLVFRCMNAINNHVDSVFLSSSVKIKKEFYCLVLAARNQILLHLVSHCECPLGHDKPPFDVIGNFNEDSEAWTEAGAPSGTAETASAYRLALKARTEPPRRCSTVSPGVRPPTPSALILTARWNPRRELITAIPISRAIDKIDRKTISALTKHDFKLFLNGDSSTQSDMQHYFPILEYNDKNFVSINFNPYHSIPSDGLSDYSKAALEMLFNEISKLPMVRLSLDASSALLINNMKALNCCDLEPNDRQLIVKMAGYSKLGRHAAAVGNPFW